MSFSFDAACAGLGHARPCESWLALALSIRRFIPPVIAKRELAVLFMGTTRSKERRQAWAAGGRRRSPRLTIPPRKPASRASQMTLEVQTQ